MSINNRKTCIKAQFIGKYASLYITCIVDNNQNKHQMKVVILCDFQRDVKQFIANLITAKVFAFLHRTNNELPILPACVRNLFDSNIIQCVKYDRFV